MSDPDLDLPVEAADDIDEFQARLEAGEDPDPNAYAERHPDVATRIRRILMTMRLASPQFTANPRKHEPSGILGDFRLGHEVGRGAMGIVYEAEQISLGRRVALKILPFAALADPRLLQRFKNEARAAAALDHPHIVKVHAVGQDRGVHFIAMQFVDGRTLAELIQFVHPDRARSATPNASEGTTTTAERPSQARVLSNNDTAVTAPQANGSTLPDCRTPSFFRRAGELGIQAADALEHAHAIGVVHRDIKPGNLLIDSTGNLCVSDFGLAKIASADAGITTTGDVLGTLRYMSPEQALAKHNLVDHRTDIYSLGATLYELISGRPAAPGREKVEILRNILDRDPRPLRSINPAAPADLETVIHKCLQKEAADRYATAKDFADDLRRVVAGKPPVARRVSALGRLRRWRRRNPSLAAASALAVCALIAMSAISATWALREIGHAKDLNTALDKAEYRLAENYVDHGLGLCEKGEVRAGLLWLVRAIEKAPPAADHFREIVRLQIARWGAEVGPLTASLDNLCSIDAAVLSRDGRMAWVAGDDRVVRCWDLGNGELRSELTLPARASSLLRSPDGTRILGLCQDGTAQLWDSDTCRLIGTPLPSFIKSAAWSADGEILVTGDKDGFVRQLDPRTGMVRGQEFRQNKGVEAIAITSDGQSILTAEGNKVWFWDRKTRLRLGDPMLLSEVVTAIIFHPGSGNVLILNNEYKTQVWDSETRMPLGKQVTHRGRIKTIAFGQTGRTYLTGGHDRAARIWNSATGEPIGDTITQHSPVVALDPSQDGCSQLTAATDGSVRIWGATPDRARGLILRHDSNVSSAAFSPDGTKILTGSWDRNVRLFDAITGQQIGTSLPHNDKVMAVAFRPDGEAALTVCWDKSVQQWEMHTGRKIGKSLSPGRRVSQAAFSQDGRTILTGAYDGTVQFWNAETGNPHGPGGGHVGGAIAVAFNHNGQTAATGGEDGNVQIWNAIAGQPVGPLIRHEQGRVQGVTTVTFSPDGQHILSGGRNGRVRVWVAETGIPVGNPLVQGGAIWAMALSPNGEIVLTGGEDGIARLWDRASGRPRGHPLVHQDKVLSVAFDPDGRLALTGSADGTARLWDAVTGQQIGPPLVHDGPVVMVVFRPDGQQILTASHDRTARLWSVPVTTTGSLEELVLSVETLTGLTLDENDVLSILGASEWHDRVRRLKTLQATQP